MISRGAGHDFARFGFVARTRRIIVVGGTFSIVKNSEESVLNGSDLNPLSDNLVEEFGFINRQILWAVSFHSGINFTQVTQRSDFTAFKLNNAHNGLFRILSLTDSPFGSTYSLVLVGTGFKDKTTARNDRTIL